MLFRSPATPDETPFGKLTIVSSTAPDVGDLVALDDVIPFLENHAPLLLSDFCLIGVTDVWRGSPPATASCRRLALLCVWRV